MPRERAPEAGWDAELYDRAAAFVWQHGSELIDLLAPRPGGRFVAQLGGKGNVQTIVTALTAALAEAGHPFAPDRFPWYFPTIGEYAALFEAHGLEPVYAALFDRPTRLDGGEAGLRTWLALFAGRFFEDGPAERQAEIVRLLEERLRPQLFRDGAWFADYRRLRILAVKRA